VLKPFPCIAAVLIAFCACGVAGIRADEPGPFEVSIRLRVDRSITSRFVHDVFEHEAAEIWQPYGVQIAWDDGDGSDPRRHGFPLEVLLDPRIGGAASVRGRSVLGNAAVDLETPVRRPIRVSFDATEHLLSLGVGNRPSNIAFIHDRDLARALGRVLAHEIGHVLLGAPYHEDQGLMRPAFHAEELAAPERAPFRLTCLDVDRLRSRLRVLTGERVYEIESAGVDRGECIRSRTLR
jgi:hypothetical protein